MANARPATILAANLPMSTANPILQRAAWITSLWREKLRGDSPERQLNRRLIGYPRNHDYLLVDGKILPSPRLQYRWRRIAELYPQPLTSLLDVGCSKGYFVLEAASRPTCKRAVGTDVDEPFVETSRRVAAQLGMKNTSFFVTALDAFAADPSMHGEPFQTILVLNVYHYLYAGSDMNKTSLRGHRPIMESLAKLCAIGGGVILSSPLDLRECPTQVQTHSAELGIAENYTREGFMKAASEFFDVEDHGQWGRRPLMILRRRS
ncbi:MAG TPA: class I SAM-dependent methyltransferase [Tepidisphaeraceae bacterium]|nr:class I SAM-dependent methyltransferase [Tepidisphaeraceae bacterium]